MQRKMSLCFDNKSANTEWIKSILKVVFDLEDDWQTFWAWLKILIQADCKRQILG